MNDDDIRQTMEQEYLEALLDEEEEHKMLDQEEEHTMLDEQALQQCFEEERMVKKNLLRKEVDKKLKGKLGQRQLIRGCFGVDVDDSMDVAK